MNLNTIPETKIIYKIPGLPVPITNEELEEIFKPYGNVLAIRIPVYRNGHQKGMAYIDFEDESSAAKALLATDGMKIKDKVICVAISNPQERKKESTEEKALVKSLGGHAASKSHSQPKPVLMIPRNVKLKIESNGSNSKSTEGTAPLTNKDFRDMLLKK